MANNKKLLNEATVRRFQALAAIPGLKESHGRGQHEGDGDYVSGREDLEEGMHEEDELDEEMGMGEDYDMSSLMEAEEEEEPEEESEEEESEEEEDEDMPEMDMGDMDDMGDVGAGASAGAGDVEGALQKALKAMADVLGQELNVSIDVVGSGEAGKEMAPAAPMGGEEVPPPEEETPEMGAMTESVRRLVNKVEKRVKARIQKEMLEETLLKRVAKRLLEAKKPAAPVKKPAAPVKKPAAPVKKPVKK